MSVADPGLDFQRLQQALRPQARDQIFQKIVNAPFEQAVDTAFLFLGFICLYLADKRKKTIKLVAASHTEHYEMAVKGYEFDPDDYNIPLANKDNDIVRAYLTGEKQVTLDWASLSRKEENQDDARLNQANSGIAYSVAYPLLPPAAGVLMFFYYQYQEDIDEPQYKFMEQYVRLVSQTLKG